MRKINKPVWTMLAASMLGTVASLAALGRDDTTKYITTQNCSEVPGNLGSEQFPYNNCVLSQECVFCEPATGNTNPTGDIVGSGGTGKPQWMPEDLPCGGVRQIGICTFVNGINYCDTSSSYASGNCTGSVKAYDNQKQAGGP